MYSLEYISYNRLARRITNKSSSEFYNKLERSVLLDEI